MNVDFSRLEEAVNKKFYSLIWDTNRTMILFGGAGSGKSVFKSQDVVYTLLTEKGHNYLVCRKTGKSNRFSTFALLKQTISQWGLTQLFRIKESDMSITSKTNGNQIVFTGLDDIEKIKSITFPNGILTDIWIEEANEILESDFTQLNLRLRGFSLVPFQITLTFNPISKRHWIFKRWFAGKIDENTNFYRDEHVTVLRTTYLDNAWIDEDYRFELENLKKIDQVYYDIYALGKWGILGELVFRNFEFQSCPYGLDEFDFIVAGMDFGFSHRHAIEIIGLKGDDKWSFDELYLRHLTNDEVIKANEEGSVLEKGQECTADSAEPKSIREWQQHNYRVNKAIKGPDSVSAGIDWLNRGVWYIDPNTCPGLAQEVETYQWKIDPKTGEPTDKPAPYNDDAIAACRYAGERFFTDYRRSGDIRQLAFAVG